MGEKVTLEVAEGIALVTINNPPVNALSAQVLQELEEILDELTGRTDVAVTIITGAGERAFVAGADINQFLGLNGVSGIDFARRGQGVFNKVEELPMPTIAAVNGVALGGGCELALACDLRVAAENATFGQPEVNLGLMPGYGGSQRLPRVIGVGLAKEMIYTGEAISAQEAYRIGLANRVVPRGQAVEEAKNLARKIASRGPLGVRLAKKAIDWGRETALRQGLALEAQHFGYLCGTEDAKEGAKAFLEKRAPVFRGR
ncbi:MAG: enoyl-CoA hydratase/isomerase family protein [Clostridia bacterium]|nr:enoyl-CoA hydratase/isomerase family protein [Clostridia bacterium]